MDHTGGIQTSAEAAKAIAETSGKAIDLTQSLGRVVKGPVEQIVGMMTDKLTYIRWERRKALEEKARAYMKGRGLLSPTRTLPPNFAVPLLTQAFLEEDDELQEVWARLLVNAGDESTPMELRTAYVSIISNLSGFDVKNLSKLAETAIKAPRSMNNIPPLIIAHDLPGHAQIKVDASTHDERPISEQLGISLANLNRLGCASPSYGFGGMPIFNVMTVTQLGLALYRACS